MTVAEAIAILEGLDPLATLCVSARGEDGDTFSNAVEDIVAMGDEVVLISPATRP